MGQINLVRVLICGPLAGVVIIAANLAAQLVLGDRIQSEMTTAMPGATGRMQVTGPVAVAAGFVMKLVIGTVLVWLYATSRLGPGVKAATLVALTAWLLGAIFFSDFPLTGMMTWATYALLEVLQLLAFLAAAWVGAWLYGKPVELTRRG